MPTLGTPITAAEANDLISQDLTIKNVLLPHIQEAVLKHMQDLTALEHANPSNNDYKNFVSKIDTHYRDTNNIYIFSMDDISRFVTEKAEYLMIIVGSQRETKNGYQMGQSTAMIAGCNQNGSDAQGPKYQTLHALTNPATEHPPFRYERTLPFMKQGNVIEIKRSK